MFSPNHLHLLVKGYILKTTKDEQVLNKWLSELVTKVGMNVISGPTSIYVYELGNEGITGTVVLSTSHAAVHIWDKENPSLIQFDLYSCKDFDPDIVLNHIDEMFGLEKGYWSFIDRNGDTFYEISNGKYNKE